MGQYTQLQAADAIKIAAANPSGGLAGAGAGLGAGMAIGGVMGQAFQPMMQPQAAASGYAAPAPPPAPGAGAPPPPPAPAGPRWSLAIDGKTYGPYTDEALKQMIAAGQVAPSTLAWHPGASGWAPVQTLPGLRGDEPGRRPAAASAAGPLSGGVHRPLCPAAAPLPARKRAGSPSPRRPASSRAASCGADVVWNPGAAALKCPYCGAETALPTSSDQVVERPLEEALRAPRDLGWGAERKTVKCTKCGATTTFDPGVAASRCAFCATPAVVEAPASPDLVRPGRAPPVPGRPERGRAALPERGSRASGSGPTT